MQLCQEESANDDGPILVVAEAASAWTIWAAVCRANPDYAVIAQHPSEEAREFTRRATERIERFGSTGWTPRVAVLALAGRQLDSGITTTTRALLARALLRSMRGFAGGELLLAGDDQFPSEARHEVFGLAQALAESLLGTPVGVRVEFTGNPILKSRRGWRSSRSLAYTVPERELRRMRVS